MTNKSKEKLGQTPAFATDHKEGDNWGTKGCSGMSKRFYAACAAMQGVLANKELGQSWMPSEMSIHAYRCADELLKQENL